MAALEIADEAARKIEEDKIVATATTAGVETGTITSWVAACANAKKENRTPATASTGKAREPRATGLDKVEIGEYEVVSEPQVSISVIDGKEVDLVRFDIQKVGTTGAVGFTAAVTTGHWPKGFNKGMTISVFADGVHGKLAGKKAGQVRHSMRQA